MSTEFTVPEVFVSPVIPIRDVVVFPHTVLPIFVGRAKSLKAVEAAMQGDRRVILVTQRDPKADDPKTSQLFEVGVAAKILQMLKLSEFQNPLTGLNFQGTGTLSTPLGAKLLRTSAVPAGKLIGLDKNYALEHICGSEVMVEYDKLIDRQIERAAITSISGFAKPYQEASKVLTV